MSDLFYNDTDVLAAMPLAARMRPDRVDDYVGQTHLLGEGKPLRIALEKDTLHSMIFWGPPGVGKTSLAHILAAETQAEYVAISAVLSGVKDIRAAIDAAIQRQSQGQKTILFVDEVHRFNKAQQDAFLPHVENGTIIFVGATTENPSFELNNALLSRCRVYILKKLTEDDLAQVLDKALTDSEKGLGHLNIQLTSEARQIMLAAAQGDTRQLLTYLEIASDLAQESATGMTITKEILTPILGSHIRHFDKKGDVFYEQISALHKAVRGSDPDAALYWCTRMLDGGCDPLYVARRLVRMAIEDIGNADPRALTLTLQAWDVQERLGSPEGELALAQAVLYLAVAAKSNAAYVAFKKSKAWVKDDPGYDVPLHLRNAPTQLMKSIGYGKEYRYDHDESEAFAEGQSYWPDDISSPPTFYEPVSRGLEVQIAEKLSRLKKRS